jgi:hypothetical protein
MNPNQDNIIYQNEPLINEQSQNLISEKIIDARSGCCMLLCLLLGLAIEGILVGVFSYDLTIFIVLMVILAISFFIFIFLVTGFCTIQINEARVLTLFGKYYGTVKKKWISLD